MMGINQYIFDTLDYIIVEYNQSVWVRCRTDNWNQMIKAVYDQDQ